MAGVEWKLEHDAGLPGDRSEPAVGPQPEDKSDNGLAWLSRLRPFLPCAILVCVILVFWEFVLSRYPLLGIAPQYLGSPSGVATRFATLVSDGYTDTPLWQHFFASISRTVIGVVAAAIIGIPLGLAIGLNRFLDRLLSPIIGFLRPIPALAWIPIVVIWLGIGEESKVFVIFMSSFLFTVTGAILGVKAVPTDYYYVARNYGLNTFNLVRKIVLPPALPQIIAGLRTALTVGWAVVVAAELIGASTGLGYLIRNASQVFDVNAVYVGIFLIGVVGVAFEYGFRFIERKLLHWQVAR